MQMRGAYVMARPNVATSTAISVVQLKVPATAFVELSRFELSSSLTTDSQNRLQLIVKSAAATVTAQSPQVLNAGANAPASLCVSGTAASGITATAEGTNGAVIKEQFINPRVGYLWFPAPEDRIMLPPSTIIAVLFPAAPTSGTYSIELEFIEYA